MLEIAHTIRLAQLRQNTTSHAPSEIHWQILTDTKSRPQLRHWAVSKCPSRPAGLVTKGASQQSSKWTGDYWHWLHTPKHRKVAAAVVIPPQANQKLQGNPNKK